MRSTHRVIHLLCVCLWGIAMSGNRAATLAATKETVDQRAARFIAEHESQIRPLEIEVGTRWWIANTSGKDEDFARKQEIETQLDLALADKTRFAELKAIHEGGVKDPLVARQIKILYLQYLSKQVDPELLAKMVAKANAVEQAFNIYRPTVEGQELSDNDVRQVLRRSTDSARRRAVWEASKGVGAVVAADLRGVVDLRNEAARKLGFKNYHVMQLSLAEQSQEQVIKLFDELDELTREPFRQAKAEIDGRLAELLTIPVDELQPWHYHDPFFQESPAVFNADLDSVYAKVDILKLCREFYAGIGLPIDDVIARSDLYERKGKSPHAFCTDIDREGDVRVLANITASEQWMGTMLHELGHSVYSSKNIPRTLPYVVRTDAHILCTEGVAMQFERFSKSADWLASMGVTVPDPKQFNEIGAKLRRNQLLIFSRWCQVMLRFEKGLYENPDQDLNALWWSLVEKYQLVKRPAGRNAPDYAAKIHIVSAPCYYHNYMLGQLFASQVHHALAREVLRKPANQAIYTGRKEAGEFMRTKVFAPGRTLDWNALTRHATGEDLNPKAFAADFQD
ncbi:MAG: M2 family metallopeptidase [Planctomycetaceae bacterium]|nr:M2 family metallopeptidase [Planctomycetaceae bacterium]